MIFALSAILTLAAPQAAQGHTELQVEATQPPDRRAELSAEISRAQAELEDVRRVASALPDGEQKTAEEKRLTALSMQIDQMRKLVADLPEPPRHLVPHRAADPVPAKAPAPVASTAAMPAPEPVWIALGFGLIIGTLLAFLFVFRLLPGTMPTGAMRGPQLAILSAIIAAVGPQLQTLGYDQFPIIVLWIALGVGVVIRMGMRRVRSQMDEFSLDRLRRKATENDDE